MRRIDREFDLHLKLSTQNLLITNWESGFYSNFSIQICHLEKFFQASKSFRRNHFLIVRNVSKRKVLAWRRRIQCFQWKLLQLLIAIFIAIHCIRCKFHLSPDVVSSCSFNSKFQRLSSSLSLSYFRQFPHFFSKNASCRILTGFSLLVLTGFFTGSSYTCVS